jgi:hypothetical protein
VPRDVNRCTIEAFGCFSARKPFGRHSASLELARIACTFVILHRPATPADVVICADTLLKGCKFTIQDNMKRTFPCPNMPIKPLWIRIR